MRWIALLFVALALSGCASEEPTTETPIVEETPTEVVSSPWNITSINGTFAANTTNTFDIHPIFFNWTANFILNGTEEDFFQEIIDAETVGNFTWTFDQDTDGTPEATGSIVPFNITTFYAPGNYSATLIMEGGGHVWNGTIPVSVKEFIPPIPATILQGIVLEPCPLCYDESAPVDYTYSLSHTADENGRDGYWQEIPADLIGAPYFAKSTAGNMGLSFQDTCNGNEIEPVTPGDVLTGAIPSGAGCVWMWQDSSFRGTKLSFIIHGNGDDIPDDGMCWATDFNYVGVHESGQGFYQTDLGWGYLESNGVPGLQWSHIGNAASGNHKEGCENGDLILY